MKIVLIGSSGAMGHVVESVVNKQKAGQIVAGFQEEVDTSRAFPTFSDFNEMNQYFTSEGKADVIIDFSTAALTEELLEFAQKQKLPIMLATTGQTPEQEAKIKEAAKHIAILDTHNTSIGVNVMEKAVGDLTKALYPLGYDVEIIEKHHRYKVDAPSGTAKMLYDSVTNNTSEDNIEVDGRSGISEPRKHQEIGVHAIRGGDIVGEHTVIFANNQEVLEITHRAGSKEIFASGAIRGATFILDKEAGIYDMHDAL